MKKFCIASIVILSLVLFSQIIIADPAQTASSNSEQPIMIGIPDISPRGLAFFKKYGVFFLKPYPMREGIQSLAYGGMICAEFGHNYKDHVCKLCGKIEPEDL